MNNYGDDLDPRKLPCLDDVSVLLLLSQSPLVSSWCAALMAADDVNF